MEHENPAFPAVQEAPVPVEPAKETHGPSQAALVLGILACAFNILLILAIFGIILGIIAVIMGAVNYRRHRHAKAGLILGLVSFVPLAVYLATIVAIYRADPLI